jgi:anti-anti-sigma regulatory factor
MTDFSVTTTTPREAPTVREIGFCGAMTILHAGEIRTAMLEALAEADEVRLEMAQVKEIDLMGLQLLCSAHRTSVSLNKRFILGGCCASVKETIQDSGFKRYVGCEQDVDHTCIWIQGGT